MTLLSGSPGPYLIAHRGAMAEAPENTAAAFERALAFPIDGIEFDVQLTRDGVPVVFHDGDLNRITGEKGAVSDYSLAELKTFDYGRWFSEAFVGTTIPTLEEVLEHYAHRTALLIELKIGDDTGRSDEKRAELVQQVIALIRQWVPAERRGGIYILSFDSEALDLVHRAAPDLKCIRNLEQPVSISPDGSVSGYLHGFGIALDRITEPFVRAVHGVGKKVMTYSCNTRTRIDQGWDAGIDYLLTDHPAAVAAHFRHVKPK